MRRQRVEGFFEGLLAPLCFSPMISQFRLKINSPFSYVCPLENANVYIYILPFKVKQWLRNSVNSTLFKIILGAKYLRRWRHFNFSFPVIFFLIKWIGQLQMINPIRILAGQTSERVRVNGGVNLQFSHATDGLQPWRYLVRYLFLSAEIRTDLSLSVLLLLSLFFFFLLYYCSFLPVNPRWTRLWWYIFRYHSFWAKNIYIYMDWANCR